MFHYFSAILLLYFIQWINVSICKINAYDIEIGICKAVIHNSGNKTINSSFDEITNAVNKWNADECENDVYQVNIEKGIYTMNETICSKSNLFNAYYEPSNFYFGIRLVEISNSVEFIGEVDEETNEPTTVFECPGVGFGGFVDRIYKNRNLIFRNIKFTKCYNHWFRILHFYSFDDTTNKPEYRFENCLFENNYDESIFFYEFLAGTQLANTFIKIDGIPPTSTKTPLVFKFTNSIFRQNHVWNRENCEYDYAEDISDCYFSDHEVTEKKKLNDDYTFCNPSNSDHSIATIMIFTPMYYDCKKNYGNCYADLNNPILYITNTTFIENTGGSKGLFDLSCINALFNNNTFINNWGVDSGLIYSENSILEIRNDLIKDQHSYWGNSNALFQLTYTNLLIRNTYFFDIESQTSSIINVMTDECIINIYNSIFEGTIYPFELSDTGSTIKCYNCVIKNINRLLSKNKPTIGKTSGTSNLEFYSSEIYNITTLPLFKVIESSQIQFSKTSIHDINSIANIGLIDILTSAKVSFDDCNIYSVNFKRVLDDASFIKFSSENLISIKNSRVYDINIDGNFLNIASVNDADTSLIIENSSFENFNINTGSIINFPSRGCMFQIKNTKFINNIRNCDEQLSQDDSRTCPGVIHINNDINESTIDECLFQNNTSGIGPAITINGVNHIELNIQNSKFYKNTAIFYGGALYIEGEDYQFSGSSMKLRNLEFVENHSNSGGAIYIDFPGYSNEIVESSKFINNSAVNGGGAFFIPFNIKEIQPKMDKLCELENNYALYGKDYSSKPHSIELLNDIDRIETYSGESVKTYEFTIKDEYGEQIKTSFKDGSFSLQSMIFLKLYIISNSTVDNYNIEERDDVEIIGESFGYFQDGICSFKMQFYQKENKESDYILLATLPSIIEGYEDVSLKIDLHMSPCPLGHILEEKSTESKFKGCILAICDGPNECVEGRGKCVDNNVCDCDEGFHGDICQYKTYYELNEKLKLYSTILAAFGIIFTIICFIFVLIKRNKFIVKMSKISHLFGISFGCILSFASIFVDYRKSTGLSCTLRESLINIGFIITYSIFYLKMYYYIINNVPENLSISMNTSLRSYNQGNSKAGVESSMKVSKFEMSMDVKSGFNYTSTMNQGNDIIKQTDQTKKEVENIANNLFRKQYIEALRKSFQRIFGFVIIIFLICFLIDFILFLKGPLEESRTSDSKWAYVCESKSFIPVPYAIHLILLLLLFTNVKKCWALSTMHAETKHICYSIGIWISIGPLVQLICVSMINQNVSIRFFMMLHSIFVSQFIIVYLMLGLKVIAILRGAGDTSNYTNSKLTQFYNEPSNLFNNENPGETTNSFRQ